MSPGAKEELYRMYMAGSTVKELSLKYGILPQRVKAIVWLRFTYWHEIYPKVGEAAYRMGLEVEEDYAKDFPFVDYGIDLDTMKILQNGVAAKKLRGADPDIALVNHEEKLQAFEHLKHQRSSKYNFVPTGFSGKGTKGYKLVEWVVHRGKGAPKVSNSFDRAVRLFGSKDEHLLSDKLRRRMKAGGPRFAVMGKTKR